MQVACRPARAEEDGYHVRDTLRLGGVCDLDVGRKRLRGSKSVDFAQNRFPRLLTTESSWIKVV